MQPWSHFQRWSNVDRRVAAKERCMAKRTENRCSASLIAPKDNGMLSSRGANQTGVQDDHLSAPWGESLSHALYTSLLGTRTSSTRGANRTGVRDNHISAPWGESLSRAANTSVLVTLRCAPNDATHPRALYCLWPTEVLVATVSIV